MNLNDGKLNNIKITPYKRHPRVVELRLILVYNALVREFGDNYAQQFFRKWCDLNKINSVVIFGIIAQNPAIRKLSVTKKERYRQEVILAGFLCGKSRLKIAKQYLGLTPRFLYSSKYDFAPEDFVTKEWLAGLDDHVVVCGVQNYRIEAERFLDALDMFTEVMG